MTDAQTRLEQVRAAISDVLKKGQRLKRADREIYRAELDSLRLLEQQYAKEVALEQASLQGRGRNRISYMVI
ncbi:hypothetical protein [Pseudomonas syringae]|uniref:Preprotein translocase subunit SecA n=2 Tax=Pseudomonas syringae TaxID=317 RepID=F3G6T1_PSESJ|nr:hypothetical protein [Pseudomonas syringae]EGH42781.1 hypothetical protein PSYPI_10400 [Pseudomonas syringae pv. pisi str. 1704B]PYD08029.1 hypothetical protein DND62_29050 [Pseudomonas syringae pv. pisi]RMM26332.1 hypothetical protein ALQ82_01698 [Pseudomonas syringae pv. pisi]RMU72253.1 hypothetical protein ALP24_00857 [Pseudomonas syringae pv. aptata]